MADDKTQPLEPVAVTVIDTGSHGDQTLPDKVIATTADIGTPNLIVTVVGPVMALFVRFVNVFLTSLVGVITAASATNLIPATDFFDLLWKSATLCVAGAGIDLLKNLVTIFGRLESKYPLLTGSV
jgi:hypothetical protein